MSSDHNLAKRCHVTGFGQHRTTQNGARCHWSHTTLLRRQDAISGNGDHFLSVPGTCPASSGTLVGRSRDDRTTTGRAKASVSGSAPPSRSAQPDPAVAVGVREPDGGRAPLRQVIDRPRSVSIADGDQFHWTTAQLTSRGALQRRRTSRQGGNAASGTATPLGPSCWPTRRTGQPADEDWRPPAPISAW